MTKGRSSASAERRPSPPSTAPTSLRIGPPVLLLLLAFASVLVSLPLIVLDGAPAHVVGYVTGALVPILLIGFFRRVDLDRRRSPGYRARGFVRPTLAVLAVSAVVAAGLHVWPIATELAS